ncbi:MAG: hypothetical protein GVY05_05805 [Bacteroidetes bacterium]|jgi:hypothetical protein|nr:hypothetical protein [Bacteroidota bacterium]
MKALLHLVAVLSFGFLLPVKETADIHIEKGSQISIMGSSNVNRFTCSYSKAIAPGCQVIAYDYKHDTFLLEDAIIDLKSNAFDCGGKLINKDFNELMESEEHPHIKIKFKKIEVGNDEFLVHSQIEIAHKVNSYSFTISTINNYNYCGSLELNIEDFGMEPPRKLLGAIQVDPLITINFDLNLEFK